MAWVVSAEDCPGDPGVEPAAAPTCTAAVEKCSVYGAIPDSCNFSPFSVTVARVAEKCGINCGFISLELQSTCVAAINFSSIGTMQAQAHVAAEACMNAKLVGTRWDCAPDAGWISVYIGSCTLL